MTTVPDEKAKKSVDESWKAQMEKEKKQGPPPDADAAAIPDASFPLLVSSMSMQAMVSLGIIANPVTEKTDENLSQARFVIDTLAMLKEKTAGNLTDDESRMLENVLYEMRMVYIQKKGGES